MKDDYEISEEDRRAYFEFDEEDKLYKRLAKFLLKGKLPFREREGRIRKNANLERLAD